ncbi:MAG: hypothetical protein K2X68_12140 [Novosphingobium sp.]|nr:hypothetical protein [Novosphingobium sp.]
MPITMPLLATALLAGAQATEAPDFSGLLSTNENTVRSCAVVNRADGDHLIMSMAPNGEGDSIHIDGDLIDGDDNFPGHDYIFATDSGKKRHFRTESKTLSRLQQIDIPVRTAMGLRGSSAERIFAKSGTYRIYVGFNFRGSDESQIFGACQIRITVK